MSEHLVRAEALQLIKKSRRWSDADLARAVGRTQQQVRTWFLPVGHKEARQIGERLARSLEEKLGIPRFALDTGATAPAPQTRERAPAPYLATPPSQTVTEPVTSTGPRPVQVVAWGDYKLSGSDHGGAVAPRRTLETFAPASDRARFLEVNDDSMGPTYSPGDHILVDPLAAPVAGDAVLIEATGGELLLRSYRPRTGGNFDAVATNTDHPALNSVADGLAVLGVVIEHRRYRKRSN